MRLMSIIVEYRRLMLKNWVFLYPLVPGLEELVGLTIQLLQETQVG